MDKKSWLEKLESLEEEKNQPEEEPGPENEEGGLRETLAGRGKYILLGGLGLFVLVILVIIFSAGGEDGFERDLQDILARLDMLETKISGLENQESGRQQALVRMQGDFSILTMRVDKLSREMKEQTTSGRKASEARQPAQSNTQPKQQQAPRKQEPAPQAAQAPAPKPEAREPAPKPEPREPDPKPQTASKPILHEVQSGETLYRISRMYGVTVDDLRRLNNITGDRINPGQMLTVKP